MEFKTIIKTNGYCELPKAGPCGIVIFGASGNLAQKKLLPSIYNIFLAGSVPENFFIAGIARTDMDDASFRMFVHDSVKDADEKADDVILGKLCSRLFYIKGGYDDDNTYLILKSKLAEFERKFNTLGNIIFNLAIPPDLYAVITEKLSINGIINKGQDHNPFHRIMVEKPFGRDIVSASALNEHLLKYLSESQIYRIDHYLGKNTVQNILVFRFANMIFEPVWNNSSIDSVQITVSEDIGIENRAGYFEKAGLVRDMLQNHMMQLLAIVAMEQPGSFDSSAVMDEKVKVFKAIKPFDRDHLNDLFIMGQYTAGEIGGKNVPSYREEPGVNKNSCIETYFASKFFIDNTRWKGVPFYLKSGKRLDRKKTSINIVFKQAVDCLFCKMGIEHESNMLTFNIQPEQGVILKFTAKIPGAKLCLSPLGMEFNYKDLFGQDIGGDYETVILDCMLGDQTIFWRKDGIEAAWDILTPVLDQWDNCEMAEKKQRLHFYPAGSKGPSAADEFIKKDGREWIL